MTSYIVLYNLSDEVVSNTRPSDIHDVLTKEALRLIMAPGVFVQPLECHSGWLVRMHPVGEAFYLCLVTVSSKASTTKEILQAAEKLLYWVPSSNTGWLKVIVDDKLLKGLD